MEATQQSMIMRPSSATTGIEFSDLAPTKWWAKSHSTSLLDSETVNEADWNEVAQTGLVRLELMISVMIFDQCQEIHVWTVRLPLILLKFLKLHCVYRYSCALSPLL